MSALQVEGLCVGVLLVHHQVDLGDAHGPQALFCGCQERASDALPAVRFCYGEVVDPSPQAVPGADDDRQYVALLAPDQGTSRIPLQGLPA